MNRYLLIILTSLFMAGCGKDVCEELAVEVCKNCDVDDRTRDTVCACIEDGTVRNGREYFGDDGQKEAEVYCYDLKNSLKDKYAGPDNVAECAGNLELIEKYDSDACEAISENLRSFGDGGLGYSIDDDTGDWSNYEVESSAPDYDEEWTSPDTGSYWDDECYLWGESCYDFAYHYSTCDGYDSGYYESLLSGEFSDDGCYDTYSWFVEYGCCSSL